MIWWPEEIPTLEVGQIIPSQIILRPVKPTDADAIYSGAQDPEVPKFTTLPANYTIDNAINFAKNRAPERHANRLELIFAIDARFDERDGATNQLVQLAGIISLHSIDFANHRAEIGYWLVKEARNKGIGTAAVELLTEYGLMTMGFRRIDALVDNRNEASKRLLIKAGYEFEGLLKKYVTRADGSQIDMAIFAATSS
ncbi:MAG: GNAT family N-acetyltransferase [Candidatus Nanopelagicaceae bacterium]